MIRIGNSARESYLMPPGWMASPVVTPVSMPVLVTVVSPGMRSLHDEITGLEETQRTRGWLNEGEQNKLTGDRILFKNNGEFFGSLYDGIQQVAPDLVMGLADVSSTSPGPGLQDWNGGVGGFASIGADLPDETGIDWFNVNVRDIAPEPGFFDLACHSFNCGTELFGGKDQGGNFLNLGLREVEAFLIENGWVKGQPIRLISCGTGSPEAGANAFGKQMSQYFEVPVMTPTSNITIFPGGAFVIAPEIAQSPFEPSVENPWTTFDLRP